MKIIIRESQHSKPIVVIESPYAGDIERNERYARACLRDSILRGEAPYASHLLYTQEGVLKDNDPQERELGISTGFEFRRVAERIAFYIDLGVSAGMRRALQECQEQGKPYEFRCLGWIP